jgi:hypothetical protein
VFTVQLTISSLNKIEVKVSSDSKTVVQTVYVEVDASAAASASTVERIVT